MNNNLINSNDNLMVNSNENIKLDAHNLYDTFKSQKVKRKYYNLTTS